MARRQTKGLKVTMSKAQARLLRDIQATIDRGEKFTVSDYDYHAGAAAPNRIYKYGYDSRTLNKLIKIGALTLEMIPHPSGRTDLSYRQWQLVPTEAKYKCEAMSVQYMEEHYAAYMAPYEQAIATQQTLWYHARQEFMALTSMAESQVSSSQCPMLDSSWFDTKVLPIAHKLRKAVMDREAAEVALQKAKDNYLKPDAATVKAQVLAKMMEGTDGSN